MTEPITYTPTTWADAVAPTEFAIDVGAGTIVAVDETPGTPVDAENLNHMEQGILDAQETANAALAAASPLLTVLAAVYPIGCIYATTVLTNPATVFGFGTWEAYAPGCVVVGVGTSDRAFAAGATGGESFHTLVSDEMPNHTHVQDAHYHTMDYNNANDYSLGAGHGAIYPIGTGNVVTNGVIATNQNTGGGASHNNMMKYVVAYYWLRTA